MRAMTLKNVCSALALAGVAAIIAVAVFAEEGEGLNLGMTRITRKATVHTLKDSTSNIIPAS